MKWLHISDIHFNYKGYDTKKVKAMLLAKLKELDLTMDFILITGDCFYQYKGTNKEVEELVKYLKDIASLCHCDRKNIYICGGNHDMNRGDIYRNRIIDEIRENKKDFSVSYNDLCELGSEKFQGLHKTVTRRSYKSYDIIDRRDQKFRIISINSCLLSKDDDDYQKLKVCNDKLEEIGRKIKNDEKLNVLIMHHGIDCLDITDARKFEHWVEDSNIDVVYCGHTHRAAVETYNDIFRDVKQFTAGALVVDGYAVPSFYICEQDETGTEIVMNLYVYAKDSEIWVIDVQSLRKFKDGKYQYRLSRNNDSEIHNEKENILKCKTTIDYFNALYREFYGSEKIFSNKYEGYEDFNAWKIVYSLVEVGISYEQALDITYNVIKKITDKDFEIIDTDGVLSCDELRNVVYQTILECEPVDGKSEYELSCWASRYARKYSRNTEIIVLKEYGETEKLNYSYIKNNLLKEVMDKITGNTIFYEKVFKKELSRMSEDILSFLKNMGIFEIRYDSILHLIIEYVTQKPHPWIVNANREEIVKYHKNQCEGHILKLENGEKAVSISQTEAAYHICAAFLSQYDDYIGCSETSPIIILTKAVNSLGNKEQNRVSVLPMQKFQIIQLKKDIEERNMDFNEFKKNLNIVKTNIVDMKKVTLDETKKALIALWGILRKLEEAVPAKASSNEMEIVMDIFDRARGFVVKAPLRELKKCFWVEPNWEIYEITQQHLGKQMLVCLLENFANIDKIFSYLYEKKPRQSHDELVFVKNDFTSFSSEERKSVREKFHGKYNKCIFIQKEDFEKISEQNGWRDIFYSIVCTSRVS